MLDFESLPEDVAETLRDYVLDGTHPGGMLASALCNDLKMTCAQADANMQPLIWQLVNALWNETPLHCWGSPELVNAWIDKGGHNGELRQRENAKNAT